MTASYNKLNDTRVLLGLLAAIDQCCVVMWCAPPTFEMCRHMCPEHVTCYDDVTDGLEACGQTH
jgi:hypothetical protein